MKYTLLKNKATGIRSIRINKTGQVIRESENPEEYLKLRKRALNNMGRSAHDEAMRDLGMIRVRGAVSGKTYWE